MADGVRPKDLMVGDEIVHSYVRYRVVGRPKQGRYSHYEVPVTRLLPETLTLDYAASVEVTNRPNATAGSAPAEGEPNG
jgi:hypothetical protein